MITLRIVFFALILSLFFGGTTDALAQDIAAAQERIRARLTQVDDLKLQQKVGENNRGFLEARATLAPREQRIVMEENEDRRLIYAVIAAREGTTPDQVGRVRARQIAARSAPGILIQNERGEWREKR